ncbi:hypothetical protein [Sphingobacterium griseoflavum]|uniref:Uncharacterized protein n=1 Tax=Sphingobacterium griseoflavum TaxID=1474952 RepID=A0ABQ3HU58_9SPHI|nr:hypothetical protein [Sphingobacterium griseoflavum]GHE31866.1 hypothetical protein GCM10017764_13770 [Sphingobacterium griseoflavum]
MKLLGQNYIDLEGNLLHICQLILHASDIKHTRLNLSRAIEKHLDPISLVAVQDVLKDYGVESAGVRLGEYAYEDFETPFVCALQRKHWPNAALTLVTEMGKQDISFWDPEKRRQEIVY